MTKKNHKFKGHNNQRQWSRLRPPYFINKNLQFDIVRKQMKMKTDGPTLNEMSPVDSTVNVDTEETPRPQMSRPVSTSNQIKNWWLEWWKPVIIGLLTTLFVSIVGTLVVQHGIHLTRHDKDIEYLQKNENKQDGEIEQLKNKTHEITTDVRLIEQRVELTSGNSLDSKKNKK